MNHTESKRAKPTITRTVRYAGKDVEKNAREYGRLVIRIMYLIQAGDEPFDIILKVRPRCTSKRGVK